MHLHCCSIPAHWELLESKLCNLRMRRALLLTPSLWSCMSIHSPNPGPGSARLCVKPEMDAPRTTVLSWIALKPYACRAYPLLALCTGHGSPPGHKASVRVNEESCYAPLVVQMGKGGDSDQTWHALQGSAFQKELRAHPLRLGILKYLILHTDSDESLAIPLAWSYNKASLWKASGGIWEFQWHEKAA